MQYVIMTIHRVWYQYDNTRVTNAERTIFNKKKFNIYIMKVKTIVISEYFFFSIFLFYPISVDDDVWLLRLLRPGINHTRVKHM